MTEETRQLLRQTQSVLDDQIRKMQMKRNEEDRKYIIAAIGRDLTPFLSQAVAESVRTAVTEAVRQIKMAIPKIEMPKIEVPRAQVDVSIPPIKVPEPRVIVKPADVKIPPLPKMPTKMEVEGNVGLKGFSRDNPLPVTLFNQNGQYIDPSKVSVNAVGGGGGPRIVEIKKIQGADSIGVGTKTITTAGTPERLTSTATPIRRIWIQALETNTGALVIGNADVDETAASRKGLALYATQGQWFNINDLSKLWYDVGVNGEGFNYLYEN